MLKNLKSLFIVEDEEENKEAPKPSEKTAGKSDKEPVVSTPPPLPNTSVSASSQGVLDTNIVEKLLQAIEKNNLEGFDYLEYKKSLKALEKMPMDEATKYRSAFATASTMGVTLDKLIQTTNFYIGVLDKENRRDYKTSATNYRFKSKIRRE